VDLTDIVDKGGAIVAVVAGLGILLLLPLYLSQRRDLRRLVAWMEHDPDHPAEDVAASEQILDLAEAELEQLTGEGPAATAEDALATEVVAEAGPQPGPTPSEPLPAPVTAAARRVTAERPALDRITMERAALEPHPRWRRFTRTVTRPRWMIAIAAGAVLLGVAAIFGTERLLETGEKERPERAGALDPSQVTVAVLNATSVPGLGATVGDDVEANDFDLGAVSTYPEARQDTVVMFEQGQRRAASKVGANLGEGILQPIDRQAQRLAEGADVVVVVGEDRASA
jgi:LytR cell envelope-related transcriptional attenuator